MVETNMAEALTLCIFFVIASALGTTKAVLYEYTWHKLQTERTFKPRPQFGASTWVDNNDQLWLFGGKNTSGSHNQLAGLWRLNPKTLRWSLILTMNNSKLPSDGLSCYCGGLAFILANPFHMTSLYHELWMYNVSSNMWHFVELPHELKNNNNYLAFWCDQDAGVVSLFSYSNKTSLHIWNYMIKPNKWKSHSITATGDITKMVLMDTSKSKYSTWTNANGTEYIYLWLNGTSSSSILLSLTHSGINFINQIPGIDPGCRTGSVNWIDPAGNLGMLGGKMCNSSQLYSDQWILNITEFKWISVDLKKPNPSHRSDACSWKIGNSVWVYGGYVEEPKGKMVVLQDLWVGKKSEHEVVPAIPEQLLPGDTLGLSLVDKLIISGLVLLVVMAISIRLCYKRELNQIMSQLRRRRVPYHQLSQEGDRSSKL